MGTTVPLSIASFVDVPAAAGATPTTKLLQLTPPTPGLVAPDLTPFVGVTAVIKTALAADKLVQQPNAGTIPPATGNNFSFVDNTVQVGGLVTGDVFQAANLIPAIKFQFLDPTPDNMTVIALSGNSFIETGTGNDALVALGGRNILDGGSGNNTFVGGAGVDTFISDVTSANTTMTVVNFGSGDDAVITGLNLKDFTLTAETVNGALVIDATTAAAPGTTPRTAEMILPGFTANDFGSKLTLGVDTVLSATGTVQSSFLFVHAT